MVSKACITSRARIDSAQRFTEETNLSLLLAHALSKQLTGPSGEEIATAKGEVRAILHVLDKQFSTVLNIETVASSLRARLHEAWNNREEFNNWSHQAVKISYWSKPFVRFFASDLKEVFVSTGGTVYTTLDSSKRISESEDLVSHPARTLTNDNSTYEAKILVESDIKQRRVLKYLEGFSLHYTYIRKHSHIGKTIFYIEVATKIVGHGVEIDRHETYVDISKRALTEQEFADRPLDKPHRSSSYSENWLGDLLVGECYRSMDPQQIMTMYRSVRCETGICNINGVMDILEREEFLQFYVAHGNYNDVLSSKLFAAMAAELIRSTGIKVGIKDDNYKKRRHFSWLSGLGNPFYDRYLPDTSDYKRIPITIFEDKMEIYCNWPITLLLPTLIGIVAIVMYLGVYRSEHRDPATEISVIGGMVFGIIIGGTTALKVIAHPDWDVADILHRRYSSKSIRGYLRASRRGLTLLKTLANSKRSVRRMISTKGACIFGENLGGDIKFDVEVSCSDLTRYGVFKLCETPDGMLIVRYDRRLGMLKMDGDKNLHITEFKFELHECSCSNFLGDRTNFERFRNVSLTDETLLVK